MRKSYNFRTVKTGTTFQGVQFQLRVNKVAKDLSDALIEMNVGSTVFSTANGAILITDALKGKFQFRSQVITLPPNDYYYTITITFSNGDIKTYIEGHWRVV